MDDVSFTEGQREIFFSQMHNILITHKAHLRVGVAHGYLVIYGVDAGGHVRPLTEKELTIVCLGLAPQLLSLVDSLHASGCVFFRVYTDGWCIPLVPQKEHMEEYDKEFLRELPKIKYYHGAPRVVL